MPTIILSPEVELQLTAWNIATHGREFSGVGLVEKNGDVFTVVHVDLLGVGSTGFTEFPGARQRQLPLDPRRKVWFHKHPIGDGNPGQHNWSGTDRKTAEEEPFGVPAQLVQWSISIVRTPGGWVGRIDLYVPKLKTFHCEVEPKLPSDEVVNKAMELITPSLEAFIEELLKEYYQVREIDIDYDDQDFDVFGTGVYCPECGLEIELVDNISDDGGYLEIAFYECPKCGQVYYQTHANGAEELDYQATTPGWKQSFMNFWKGRK